MEIKNIEIKFEYEEKFVTIISETYRTIKEVKEKAMKKFFNIPKDIHCFYLSRDLALYENTSIGELFNNRQKVSLKLMPQKKPIFRNKKNLASKKGEVVFSDIYLNTKVYSSGFNNIGRFQNDKLKDSNSLDKSRRKNKEELKLPLLYGNKPIILKGNNDNQRYNLLTDVIGEEKNKKCENCDDNKFSEYCRNCKEFVCFNCKKKEKHSNHLFIHLDSSYESSIKIYGNIILTDIDYFKKNNNIINKDEIIINKSSSLLNINELNNKQKQLINKLKEILNMYETIISQIKNELICEGDIKIKDLINNYNKDSLIINNNISQILKKIQGQTEKMDINEFKLYFQEMNENEVKLNNINKKIINFHLTSHINNKIISMLDKMEKIADEIIKDQKNLADNYNLELKSNINKSKVKENPQATNRMYKKSYTSRNIVNRIKKEENINDYENKI